MEKNIHHKKFSSIVILTGAGISAESGIKTFRDHDGLWENHRVEDIASPEGFQRNPTMVYNFYNERRSQLLSDEVQPNKGHLALAQLEDEFKGQTTLITQNVDDLHERAGSKNILHMHGELLKMRCQLSNQVFLTKENFDANTKCLCCNKLGTLRPHIVWFGEIPFNMDDIHQALEKCDLFLSIGTSGQVYPAAMFMQVARQHGALTIEINKDPTSNSPLFDKTFHGKAGEILPKFISDFFT
tara:strand:- start:926 stop:1651 length:726 start_codon:yes stop_codon:yes gene_type:complete